MCFLNNMVRQGSSPGSASSLNWQDTSDTVEIRVAFPRIMAQELLKTVNGQSINSLVICPVQHRDTVQQLVNVITINPQAARKLQNVLEGKIEEFKNRPSQMNSEPFEPAKIELQRIRNMPPKRTDGVKPRQKKTPINDNNDDNAQNCLSTSASNPRAKQGKNELHLQGQCIPCAFNKNDGCNYGDDDCKFCHQCKPLPSVGSLHHRDGTCRSCTYLHSPGGCSRGTQCRFCHLCEAAGIEKTEWQKVSDKKVVTTK